MTALAATALPPLSPTDAPASGPALELVVDAGAELRVDPKAEFRAVLDEAWARMSAGELDAAIAKLERARSLAEGDLFNDVERADVFFRLGCCRLKLGAVANAAQLLTLALELCDRSGYACKRLRADILIWRTRCYRRQRDWDGARADAERAVVLADELGDVHLAGQAYFQASQVAERSGQLLVGRFYVERAVELFREAGDLQSAGKAINNLGGICFLMGDADAAKARLKEAFAIALELGDDIDAAYAVCSTAQVLLRGGEPEAAEHDARYALELLAGRQDHVNEIGNAQLVLGRALTDQGRFDAAADALRAAENSFTCMDSVGHRAAAWLAQGDLARREGNLGAAADAYRRAAEATQDVRF